MLEEGIILISLTERPKNKVITVNLGAWCSTHWTWSFWADRQVDWGGLKHCSCSLSLELQGVSMPISLSLGIYVRNPRNYEQGISDHFKSWWNWFTTLQKGNLWQKLALSPASREGVLLLMSHFIYDTPFDFCDKRPGNSTGKSFLQHRILILCLIRSSRALQSTDDLMKKCMIM